MVTKNPTVIRRWEAREVKTGFWAWRLIRNVVSLPMAVVNFRFGWSEGFPLEPTGSASDPNARVQQMRSQ